MNSRCEIDDRYNFPLIGSNVSLGMCVWIWQRVRAWIIRKTWICILSLVGNHFRATDQRVSASLLGQLLDWTPSEYNIVVVATATTINSSHGFSRSHANCEQSPSLPGRHRFWSLLWAVNYSAKICHNNANNWLYFIRKYKRLKNKFKEYGNRPYLSDYFVFFQTKLGGKLNISVVQKFNKIYFHIVEGVC